MRKHHLVPHPDTPADTVFAVEVDLYMTDDEEVFLSFIVRGNERLVVPELATPARGDRLWSTTCFECFLRPFGSEAYEEYNLSPSGRWAAYAFDRYRHGMSELAVVLDPQISQDEEGELGTYVCDADLNLAHVPVGVRLQLGLSAVIEEESGRISYWALAHAPGPPDFHHPDCFTAELAAPMSS